ncbi:two-component system response regulator RegA [Fluviicoccus keumensis]|uniref:Two-component system response regulator RegA n=1 Tax=Fluviicoccus keumensis TaxID=1435465 RepID=A0A4V6MFY6_9GAMM|nr:response regulator transcription factor [Fluviicoccus keumensis]RZU45046.1 two-component system response regulator RegA [Fluviicoccus keumensis]
MDELSKPLLLLVDDDETFRQVLQRAMSRRGYDVIAADSVDAGVQLAKANPPEFAVVDLRMPGASGLELVKALHELDDQTRIVVLTGYASIATAVEAIKLGAVHYLAKPATADEIITAFGRIEGQTGLEVPEDPMSVDRLEWEHIHKVLQEHEGNISATARALKMHRRTLQRKLAKYPVRA